MNPALPRFEAEMYLIGERVHYRIEKKKVAFPIQNILLIGEFSVVPGTHTDDYFFTVIAKNLEEPLEIPSYTEGLFELLSQLKNFFPELGTPKLQMSTDYDSNILFPAQYEGKTLYLFEPELKPLFNFPILRHLAEVETVEKKLNPELVLN